MISALNLHNNLLVKYFGQIWPQNICSIQKRMLLIRLVFCNNRYINYLKRWLDKNIEHLKDVKLTIRRPTPSRNPDRIPSKRLASHAVGRKSHRFDSRAWNRRVKSNDGNVIVDRVGVIILMGDSVAGVHDFPSWLVLVVDVLGAKVDFKVRGTLRGRAH